MIKVPNKIGFHTGPAGGNMDGIGDWMKALDKARIPFCLKAVDHYGPIFEAQELMKKSGVPHVLIFRISDDSYTYDTPPYKDPKFANDPEGGAEHHWNKTLAKLPPEFDKERVWLEVVNEVDRNLCWWLGRFGVTIANLAQRDGYKVSLFGWAGGEPEPTGWEVPEMLACLRLAGERPQQIAIAVHEYSFVENDILFEFPFKIGRFMYLFAVCDKYNIPRPRVHVTEWGWTLNSVPGPTTALADIKSVGALYARFPEIEGAAIWYLGPDFGGIADKAQQLIKPVTDFTLSTQHEVAVLSPPIDKLPEIPGWDQYGDPGEPVDPDPPDGGNCNPRVPYARENYVVPQDVTMARYLEVAQQSYAGRKTITFSYDDAGHAPGVTSNTAVLYDIPADKQQEFLNWYAKYYPGTQVIFAGESAGFTFESWPTNHKVVTQKFGANPQNYAQFGLPGHEGLDIRAPHDSAVYAVADGVVTAVGDDRENKANGGHNYGVRIYIDHADGWQTVYAHLNVRHVDVGKTVKAGQLIANADNTDNSFGSHLHLTLKRKGFTYTDAKGNVWPFNIFDPTPFIAHFDYTIEGETQPPPVITPPPATGPARIGLHASADPGDLYGGEAEFGEFATLFPGVIKVLNAHSETAVKRLATDNPGAEWIVRAFQKGWDRNITPQQFFDWTSSDTLRTVNALRSLGIGDGHIRIELHNEPNLVQEGWGSTWVDGKAFNGWLLDVLGKYRNFLPTVKYLYPGLSPGGNIPGVRTDSGQFLDQSLAAAQACDGVGLHTYWSDPFPIQQAYAYVDWYVAKFGTKPLWITEASRNDRPATKTPLQYASEYYAFWQELKRRPSVQGVTFFVASGSNSYFAPECWVVNKQSQGIAAEIKKLKGA